MTSPLMLEQSRAYPVGVEQAHAALLATPLEQIFTRRFGPLPPVKGVRDQDGRLGDRRPDPDDPARRWRHHARGLTSVVAGVEFGYRIDDVTGGLKPLVSTVEGRWAFAPVGTGVRVTWAWTVHPRNAGSVLTMPVLGRLWQGLRPAGPGADRGTPARAVGQEALPVPGRIGPDRGESPVPRCDRVRSGGRWPAAPGRVGPPRCR